MDTFCPFLCIMQYFHVFTNFATFHVTCRNVKTEWQKDWLRCTETKPVKIVVLSESAVNNGRHNYKVVTFERGGCMKGEDASMGKGRHN